MKQSIILGIGTGRCGTVSLAKILNGQTDARVTAMAKTTTKR